MERCIARWTAVLPTVPTVSAIVRRRNGTAFGSLVGAGIGGIVCGGAKWRTAAGEPGPGDTPGAAEARCTATASVPPANGTTAAGPTGAERGAEAARNAGGSTPKAGIDLRTGDPATTEPSADSPEGADNLCTGGAATADEACSEPAAAERDRIEPTSGVPGTGRDGRTTAGAADVLLTADDRCTDGTSAL
ncbi:hypothetical protein ACH492_33165 [Streptomyces sp. NPDC019443]|uniref:hypothetical protein n=1 Tax=Streptomyces sp. NPDC019443 TaxID=3365061 RepID=UPI0037A2D617